MALKIKRVYVPALPEDGYRILTDRLWPQGESKEKAAIDFWAKEIAPSNALRTAFHHTGMSFEEFQKHYWEELSANPYTNEFRALVKEHLAYGSVTLVYASKNETQNEAVILKALLEQP
ncbi:MAG: DUF488 family protein [Christensenella sp.]|nr:DUF488 family protein [Christensenella sp.]